MTSWEKHGYVDVQRKLISTAARGAKGEKAVQRRSATETDWKEQSILHG
jgi:hypothetical protein